LVDTLQLHIRDEAAGLGPDTIYNYTLDLNNSTTTTTITSSTAFGAVYALESFVQLLGGGCCLPGSAISVDDAPTYAHRGLMLDTSRFIPVPQLERQLDAMYGAHFSMEHHALEALVLTPLRLK
jgi:hexosaminidase